MHTFLFEKYARLFIFCPFLDETHWAIGMAILPNQNFPIVFESVNGVCKQEIGDTSHFNTSEVDMVINWIAKLLQIKWNDKEVFLSDIGIVSPYKKQCKLIRDALKNNSFDGISVGTAEIYQGQERRIMIISTVRTGDDLGFVSNEQVMDKL